ncbi:MULTISPECIES: reductase [unclassified Gordonia (in: high G+C Gram-positive bacteria)]|uniref:reductase n=1 Tax=unclassified Gordonia (in: high G+C Gram-positive bacteria) TaxID=2657482 RepID=UPI00083B5906|nr:reductase [Gordonia sp. p3-SID1431]MCT1355982.1 ferritin-like domain-containing protein [Gordonia sp. p3-SID1431]OCW87712.1 reductase [Nocardia farcinica]
MAIDLDNMLQKIKDRQWALIDIDWDAPGAELIDPDLHAKLKPFMSDLMWIENVGARGFAAMAKKAPTPTLKSIYEHFHAEEQKHANAELALMRRWGMLGGAGSGASGPNATDDEIPSPNVNVQLVINWLDRHSDDMSLSFLGTVIPMLEVALDGALIKFITDEVKDPVAQEVFRRINSDESRHLAVDFEVMEILGHAGLRKRTIDFVGGWVKPTFLIGALSYVPLLNKMRDNIVAMGVDEERLYSAMKRYRAVGDRSEYVRRLPMFQVVAYHGAAVINRGNVPYHLFADSMVKLTDRIPFGLVHRTPTWSQELTYEPTA